MIPQIGKMYSIKEVAAILEISRDSVVRLMDRGELGYVEFPRMGGRGRNRKRLIPETEIDRFFKKNYTRILKSIA